MEKEKGKREKGKGKREKEKKTLPLSPKL